MPRRPDFCKGDDAGGIQSIKALAIFVDSAQGTGQLLANAGEMSSALWSGASTALRPVLVTIWRVLWG